MTIIENMYLLIYMFRIYFVARISTQLNELIDTTSKNENVIVNELLESGWTFESACLRYILLKSCESALPIFGLASYITIISKFFHKSSLSFMLIEDNEAVSVASVLSGWLFIVICFQTNITSMPDEDRYWRLLRNLGLIVLVNMHSLCKPVSGRLQSLSSSRTKSWHKHVRVLFVSLAITVLSIWFLIYLWSNMSINGWSTTVTVFGIEMIMKMFISLIIYVICMINSFCDVTWRGLEDHIYYLKASGSLVSYLCGISLFFNGTWLLIFENSTAVRALSLCIHLYFNIWIQAWKGWNSFNKRRLAGSKMSYLCDASEQELLELDDVCSICFQKLDNAKATTCKHYFHADCLTRWLYLQDTCPLCFRQLFAQQT